MPSINSEPASMPLRANLSVISLVPNGGNRAGALWSQEWRGRCNLRPSSMSCSAVIARGQATAFLQLVHHSLGAVCGFTLNMQMRWFAALVPFVRCPVLTDLFKQNGDFLARARAHWKVRATGDGAARRREEAVAAPSLAEREPQGPGLPIAKHWGSRGGPRPPTRNQVLHYPGNNRSTAPTDARPFVVLSSRTPSMRLLSAADVKIQPRSQPIVAAALPRPR